MKKLDCLMTEDQRELRDLAHEFAEKEIRPVCKECDEKSEFPMEVYKKACEIGLGMVDIPVEYGGSGLDALTAQIVSEEISWGDVAFKASMDT